MLEIDIGPHQQRERSDIGGLNVVVDHIIWAPDLC